MKRTKDLYDYKPPKSGNSEVSYFLTKGRITRKAFFLRLLLVIVLYSCYFLVYDRYYLFEKDKIEESITAKDKADGVTYQTLRPNFATQLNIVEQSGIFLLFVLVVFLLIQGAKRMHDVNKSGLYFLVPLFGIFLTFLRGTIGNNDYGVDPKPQKTVKYFDELE